MEKSRTSEMEDNFKSSPLIPTFKLLKARKVKKLERVT